MTVTNTDYSSAGFAGPADDGDYAPPSPLAPRQGGRGPVGGRAPAGGHSTCWMYQKLVLKVLGIIPGKKIGWLFMCSL